MKRLGNLALIKFVVLFLGLSSAASLHATIISTDVNAGMAVRYYDSNNVLTDDAVATSNGATSASVDVTGSVTGANAYSNLGFSALGSETATFNFDIGYNGNGYSGQGYMGQSGANSNNATINYDATSNFDMTVDWNFDYFGPNPFGLQIINLSGGPSQILGNFGQVGHHEGSTSFSMVAGNSYQIMISFVPNVWGGIGSINGSLAGAFDFTFNSQVPEPGVFALLMFGLAGLGFVRRKKKLG